MCKLVFLDPNPPACTLEFLLVLVELDAFVVVDEELWLIQHQEVGTMCRHSSFDKFLMLEVVEMLEYAECKECKLMIVGGM